LALIQTYGSNAWRIHNYLLESTAKQAEKALEDLKQLTVEVNRERKNAQVSLSLCTDLWLDIESTNTDANWKPAYIVGDTMDRIDFECASD
jgi:hypothetical protein